MIEMRLWKRRQATEKSNNVVELFPEKSETGPTILMSKEAGLIGAILTAAGDIDDSDNQSEVEVIHLPGS